MPFHEIFRQAEATPFPLFRVSLFVDYLALDLWRMIFIGAPFYDRRY
jgi:hypothetical protein